MAILKRKPTTDTIDVKQWWPGCLPIPGVTTTASGVATVTTIQGKVVELVPGDYVFPEDDGIHFYPVAESVVKQRFDIITPDGTKLE